MVTTITETLKALRVLADSALVGALSNLTDPERFAMATELYRLADAVMSGASPARTLGTMQAAQRRAAWLITWLEQDGAPMEAEPHPTAKP